MTATQSSALTATQAYEAQVATGALRRDAHQLKALQALDNIREQLLLAPPASSWWQRLLGHEQSQAISGLYFVGSVGTGKTLVMDLFIASLPANMAWRVHFHRFMQWVHDEKQKLGEQQDPLALIAASLAQRIRVLCLDEFSVNDITDAMLLAGLLKALFAHHVTLVTTSNTQPDDLYKDGLQRQRFIPAIALIKQHTNVLTVDSGHDYRSDYLSQSELYVYPADTENNQKLAAHFTKLSNGQRLEQTSITILNREIPIVAVGGGAVWFSFHELCEGLRSRNDYIEIASEFHSVILQDVVQLDDESNDPARRFIELIDELYDCGVNLIISAAVPAQQLYLGKRLAAPFQRTLSRLIEMSAKDYLARPHSGHSSAN